MKWSTHTHKERITTYTDTGDNLTSEGDVREPIPQDSDRLYNDEENHDDGLSSEGGSECYD